MSERKVASKIGSAIMIYCILDRLNILLYAN